MAVFERLLAAVEAKELQTNLADLAAISAALGTPKKVIDDLDGLCSRAWEQVETLDLDELQDVAAVRRSIWVQIKALDDMLWKAFSRVEPAPENSTSYQSFFTAVKKVQAAKKLCSAEDERMFAAISLKRICSALQGCKDAHFVCDNKGRLEELHAPLALLHSLQEAALQWQKQSSADKLEQAAKVGEMQSQLQQQAKCAQAELEDEQARTAASAQDAASAQEAYISLRSQMQAEQQRNWTAEAAQAELKKQLQASTVMVVELRWQKLAAQMVAQEELTQLQAAQVGLNRQLQLSTDNAKAVDLESKTLAAQMVVQVEAHREELSLMQADLNDERAKAATCAQDAQAAQEAVTSLQAQMQAGQQMCQDVEAAQAGLKRQLQSSVDNAEAVKLESKTLAAQMAAQVEAHRQEVSLMQADLKDERAKAATSAQDAQAAQEALNSLQAQMQAGQRKSVAMEAAQAGLNRQLQLSTDSAKAVDLESKTLAAQMAAQVEAHRQEVSLMQVDLEDEQARAAASAQEVQTAQAAFSSLQAQMLAEQQRCQDVEAAQAGLKTQLQVLAGKAVELRWQKLAAQMVAQLELTQPQERSSVVHAELNRDLQQAAAKVTAAEQKQEEAEAQLAAEQEAHSESLQQLESNISLEQSAKQLAGDMAKKGIGLENVFLYLARLTHQYEEEKEVVKQLQQELTMLRDGEEKVNGSFKACQAGHTFMLQQQLQLSTGSVKAAGLKLQTLAAEVEAHRLQLSQMQADVEEEKARSAAAAQSARTAQEASTSLQAQMQVGQRRYAAMEGAQARLKTQLQASTGKAFQLRWKKLAAQMVSQEEITELQERSSVLDAGFKNGLQQAVAQVTAAEQKQQEAEAQLAAEQEAHSSMLQQLQSNIEWEKYANQLAGDLAAKGIELEKVSLYLACQTHQYIEEKMVVKQLRQELTTLHDGEEELIRSLKMKVVEEMGTAVDATCASHPTPVIGAQLISIHPAPSGWDSDSNGGRMVENAVESSCPQTGFQVQDTSQPSDTPTLSIASTQELLRLQAAAIQRSSFGFSFHKGGWGMGQQARAMQNTRAHFGPQGGVCRAKGYAAVRKEAVQARVDTLEAKEQGREAVTYVESKVQNKKKAVKQLRQKLTALHAGEEELIRSLKINVAEETDTNVEATPPSHPLPVMGAHLVSAHSTPSGWDIATGSGRVVLNAVESTCSQLGAQMQDIIKPPEVHLPSLARSQEVGSSTELTGARRAVPYPCTHEPQQAGLGKCSEARPAHNIRAHFKPQGIAHAGTVLWLEVSSDVTGRPGLLTLAQSDAESPTERPGKAEIQVPNLPPGGSNTPQQQPRLSRDPAGSRSAGHRETVEYPIKRQLKSGQGAQQPDAWVFVGIDGEHRGPVSKAMLVAFWKQGKLLSQTWVYPANKGVKQGRGMGKVHQQWQDRGELPQGPKIKTSDADTAWRHLGVL